MCTLLKDEINILEVIADVLLENLLTVPIFTKHKTLDLVTDMRVPDLPL